MRLKTFLIIVVLSSFYFLLRREKRSDGNIKCQIVVSDQGRIGNQLFQYAAVFVLGLRLRKRPCVSEAKKTTLSPLFDASFAVNVVPNDKYVEWISKAKFRLWIKAQDVNRVEFPNVDVIHLQSVPKIINVIEEFRDRVLDEFRLSRRLLANADDFVSTVRNGRENVVIVGCHLRRGDYAAFFKRKTLGGSVLNERQIRRFMKAIAVYLNSPKIVFMVASDSAKWAEANFAVSDRTEYEVVFTGSNSTAFFDFAVLTRCDHNAFLYGTFGFWSSFLNDKGGLTFLPDLSSLKKSLDQTIQLRRTKSQRYRFVNWRSGIVTSN